MTRKTNKVLEEKRRKIVEEFDASNALEGIYPDNKTIEIRELYIKGVLSGEEYLQYVIKETLEKGQ